MGHILSSDTIYAVAYLTEKGRSYLFDPLGSGRIKQSGETLVDAFQITRFSLSDPDYNYEINSLNPPETGDISNISGKNKDCIRGTIITKEVNLISANGQIGLYPHEEVELNPDVNIDFGNPPFATDNSNSFELATDTANNINTLDLVSW